MHAREAARRLGVSRATLYAYVSRGLLRSNPVPGTRERDYPREAVEALARKREARRDPGGAAQQTLRWGGLPVLESSVSLISEGRLYYRGQDAIDLARTTASEDVAALLWSVPFSPQRAPRRGRARNERPLHLAMRQRLLDEEDRDPQAGARDRATVCRLGAALMHDFALLAGGVEAPTLAGSLARGWRVPQRHRPKLEAALVVTMDHELNASTFTARCVASAGASTYAALAAALCALSGAKHGGAAARVVALFDEIARARGLEAGVRARFARGEAFPGFGHPLYRDGDPRGALLLDLARSVSTGRAAYRRARRVADLVTTLTGHAPNLDLGLFTLARALKLPSHAPEALFAIGRTAGWIAHVVEEIETDRLIRPRATYRGTPPTS